MQMWGMLSDQEIDRALTTLQGSLNLSATQVSSIRELARSRRESFRSAHDQAHPKWEQLMTLLKQPDPDPAAVGRIVVDMKKVHDQALAKQTDFEKQLSTVLNPTQQQIVNNLRANADTYAALQRIGLLETPEFMKAMSN